MRVMRADRMFTLGFAQPLLRASRKLYVGDAALANRGRVLPILMYHSISDEAEEGVSPYFRVVTSPGKFRRQLGWLAREGWIGVTVTQGLEWQQGRLEFDRRPVAISFDDGFRDFRTNAFPELKGHGFGATVSLPTGLLGGKGRLAGRECMGWTDVRELDSEGIEFGSHTVSHPILYSLSWNEIERELNDSKSRIEEELGKRVTVFAYPYAFPQADRSFVREFASLLRACDYRLCLTTTVGRAHRDDDKLALRRLPVSDCDDLNLLMAKLDGAYDWLALPQGLLKEFRFLRQGRSTHRRL